MNDPRRALVVDDNDVNRKLARALLTRLEWIVEEAENGETALEKCRNQHYQLILLDISMPGMCGDEACVELRRIGHPARIIAYTAHAFPEEKEKFLSVGFDDILVKPINRQMLEEAIARL